MRREGLRQIAFVVVAVAGADGFQIDVNRNAFYDDARKVSLRYELEKPDFAGDLFVERAEQFFVAAVGRGRNADDLRARKVVQNPQSPRTERIAVRLVHDYKRDVLRIVFEEPSRHALRGADYDLRTPARVRFARFDVGDCSRPRRDFIRRLMDELPRVRKKQRGAVVAADDFRRRDRFARSRRHNPEEPVVLPEIVYDGVAEVPLVWPQFAHFRRDFYRFSRRVRLLP